MNKVTDNNLGQLKNSIDSLNIYINKKSSTTTTLFPKCLQSFYSKSSFYGQSKCWNFSTRSIINNTISSQLLANRLPIRPVVPFCRSTTQRSPSWAKNEASPPWPAHALRTRFPLTNPQAAVQPALAGPFFPHVSVQKRVLWRRRWLSLQGQGFSCTLHMAHTQVSAWKGRTRKQPVLRSWYRHGPGGPLRGSQGRIYFWSTSRSWILQTLATWSQEAKARGIWRRIRMSCLSAPAASTTQCFVMFLLVRGMGSTTQWDSQTVLGAASSSGWLPILGTLLTDPSCFICHRRNPRKSPAAPTPLHCRPKHYKKSLWISKKLTTEPSQIST